MQTTINLRLVGKRSFYFAGSYGIPKKVFTPVDLDTLAKTEVLSLWKAIDGDEIDSDGISKADLSNLVAKFYSKKFERTTTGEAKKITEVHDALEDKLGSKDKAVDSAKLEGKTLDDIIKQLTSVVQDYLAPVITIINKNATLLSGKEDHSNRGQPNGYAAVDKFGFLDRKHRIGVSSINGKIDNVKLIESSHVKFEYTPEGIVIHSNQPMPIGGVVREGIVRLSVEATEPYNPIAVGDNDPRLTDARRPTGRAAGDLVGTWEEPYIKDGAINDAKLGTRKIQMLDASFTDHINNIYEILGRHAGIIIGPKSSPAPIILNPLSNVLDELQLIAANNLSDVPDIESARFHIGAVGYADLQASSLEITQTIKNIESRLVACENQEWPDLEIKNGSITKEKLSSDLIFELKGIDEQFGSIRKVILGDRDWVLERLKDLEKNKVTKSNIGLSEVSNVPQLNRNKNLEDLQDKTKAKKALGLGTLADQDHNSVDITGGSVIADNATLRVANILDGGANLKWLKIKGTQVVSERVSGFSKVPEYNAKTTKIEAQVEALTKTLNQLLKALANHGLIGE